MAFKKATKHAAKARIALIGPSGSGKTMTALRIARGLGGKIAVLDTERGSASKYADLEFDVMEMESFHPQKFIDGISEAAAAGYDVLVIDSLSHAWMGKDGALELVDRAAKRSQSGNSFAAWRDVTPIHNSLVDAMLRAPMHIIATMRAKSEWVIEENAQGRKVPRKIGLAPVQRDGMEYEMDVVADLDMSNNLIVSKTRCPALSGAVIEKAGESLGKQLAEWLSDGTAPVPAPAPEPPAAKPAARKSEPAPANGKASDYLTEQQRKALVAAVKDTGRAVEDFKAWLETEYGATSTQYVMKRDFDAILARLTDPRPLVSFEPPTGEPDEAEVA